MTSHIWLVIYGKSYMASHIWLVIYEISYGISYMFTGVTTGNTLMVKRTQPVREVAPPDCTVGASLNCLRKEYPMVFCTSRYS